MFARLTLTIAGVSAVAASLLGATTTATASTPTNVSRSGNQADNRASGTAAAACFWFGPTARLDDPADNYAFPDKQAHYWGAMFQLPTGSSLTFEHEFAHARYQSLNSYNAANAAPTDALNDVSTRPDRGSYNPYLPGAFRMPDRHRSYTATLVDQAPPADPAARAANTLYAGVAGQPTITLAYRLYTPDRGRDLTGGVGLPRPVLHLADGTVVRGPAVCDAVQAQHRTTLPLTTLAPATYDALRNQPGKPAGFPAEATPVWRAFYSSAWNLGCYYKGLCTGTPAKIGGQYSNKDNEYVSAFVNRGFGKVLVLRGTLPVTPATSRREPFLRPEVDMRYWSLCTNESYATTRAADCVYDEDIVTDRHRHYTIVLSLPADRPRNADARHGVTWLTLSPNGDGMGHLDETFLIIRNMLPTAGFGHAIQDTRVPGDERTVMGDYLPTATYTSTADFERR